MDPEGMLVEGFDELGTLVGIYNYAYYPAHLENLGYGKDTDWVEYEVQVPEKPDERIAKLAKLLLKRYNLHLLDVKKKKDLLPYAGQLFDLLQEAYQQLYGFVPMTEEQVQVYIDQYFGFITPDFVPVVLDENDRMIAFGITMPSLSHALQKSQGRLFPFGFIHLLKALRKNDRADLYLVAVTPEYQGRGINAILIDKMNRTFNKLGVTQVESNPELEDNLLVQGQWKHYETRQHKRRRCYIKHLDA
jgi:ribosomal protein S18 acetylase RimI-like enzyme